MGVLEIPTEQITGTKTAGRRSAFAADFMPLLGEDSEFPALMQPPARGRNRDFSGGGGGQNCDI